MNNGGHWFLVREWKWGQAYSRGQAQQHSWSLDLWRKEFHRPYEPWDEAWAEVDALGPIMLPRIITLSAPELLPKAMTWFVTLMQMLGSGLLSAAIVTTEGLSMPGVCSSSCDQVDIQGMWSTGAMPVQNSCAATQDHSDICLKLLLGGMFWSVFLLLLGSELVSIAPVDTKGHAEAQCHS